LNISFDFNFLASEKIVLKPAFHIKPALLNQVCGNTTRYSTFSARIVGCNQIDVLQNSTAESDVIAKSGLDLTNYAIKSCEIFPNPSLGDVTIVFSYPADIEMIQVFNNLGVLIKQESNIGAIQKVKINIMSAPGIYLLMIHLGDSNVIRKKVVID